MPGVTFFPLNDVPFLSLFFNFYGYYLPIFLYAAWTPLALYDVGESKYSSNLSKVIWSLIILSRMMWRIGKIKKIRKKKFHGAWTKLAIAPKRDVTKKNLNIFIY